MSIRSRAFLCFVGRLASVIFPLPLLSDFLPSSDRGSHPDTVYTPFVGTSFDSPLLYATHGWFNGTSSNAIFTESGHCVFPTWCSFRFPAKTCNSFSFVDG
ncbi:hypothetical protein LI138_03695 [Phocaeicola dorei]|uniref:hypothetical protein n=1 Tax=Phocaeicola dorei TaxID=357276 RepID=UPI001C3817E8|nr:hypothetical protein [Phocaeicola dorei]MBV4238636.1 hypothetical protein [Phocaeicola dorei]MCB6461213.1 hypothetical protein [Phocaeicola dorei]MCB6771996.1 hypothetical protein [Phocaeicola dorei]